LFSFALFNEVIDGAYQNFELLFIALALDRLGLFIQARHYASKRLQEFGL
jgi:hypothetical protein